MNHIELISKYILNRLSDRKSITVALCGAADLGKSYISVSLVNFLSDKGVSSNHLPIDAFLMERLERIRKGISGYDIEAYDLKALIAVMQDFQRGKDISYLPYNHETGKRSKSLTTLKNSKILIVDGLHSMNEQLRPFLNFGIFIYTEDNQLRKMRRDADLLKRKQALTLSSRLEPIEFEKYKKYVEPYKDVSDLHIYLEKKWSYIVTNQKIKRLTFKD